MHATLHTYTASSGASPPDGPALGANHPRFCIRAEPYARRAWRSLGRSAPPLDESIVGALGRTPTSELARSQNACAGASANSRTHAVPVARAGYGRPMEGPSWEPWAQRSRRAGRRGADQTLGRPTRHRAHNPAGWWGTSPPADPVRPRCGVVTRRATRGARMALNYPTLPPMVRQGDVRRPRRRALALGGQHRRRVTRSGMAVHHRTAGAIARRATRRLSGLLRHLDARAVAPDRRDEPAATRAGCRGPPGG
jgi:hypothetical protein